IRDLKGSLLFSPRRNRYPARRNRMLLPILCLLVVSFVLAWAGTFVMIRVAPKIGFVDKPGGRKIHANPKPLGGGVAIFLAFALPMLALLVGVRILHPQDG